MHLYLPSFLCLFFNHKISCCHILITKLITWDHLGNCFTVLNAIFYDAAFSFRFTPEAKKKKSSSSNYMQIFSNSFFPRSLPMLWAACEYRCLCVAQYLSNEPHVLRAAHLKKFIIPSPNENCLLLSLSLSALWLHYKDASGIFYRCQFVKMPLNIWRNAEIVWACQMWRV